MIGVTATFCLVAPARAELETDAFTRGNAHYDSLRYDSAIAAYESAMREGAESSALYYNVGNAYFEKRDLGRAILYYLRAQRIDPGDPDIRDNLAFARRFVKLQMTGVELNPVTDALRAVTTPWSLTAWAWLASACLLALGGVIVWRILLRRGGFLIHTLFGVTSALAVVAVTLVTFKYRVEFAAPRAVVVLDDIPVRARPAESAAVEFRAAAGLEVEILEESAGFALALFENKRRGWTPADAIERL